MALSKSEIQKEMIEVWRRYIKQMERSLSRLEQEIRQGQTNPGGLRREWLQHVDCVIEEIDNVIFSIGEPKYANGDDAELIRNLKRRVYKFSSQLHEIRKRSDEAKARDDSYSF
ncbi:MAG: hypothetical protein KGY61_04025 [Desulfobacterales bacterium]|nr:hypothetical protein [Desulfobacterales bacterium]